MKKLYILLILFFLSCNIDEESETFEQIKSSWVFVACEGNYGASNGSITMIKNDGEIKSIENIGDVVQSLEVYNNKLFVIVNNSHKILAYDITENGLRLPGIEINNQTIFDSEGALEFSSIPEKLVIIGAGVIGLELGSIWSRLGSQVTLLEAQKEFLPMLDKRLSRQIFKEFSNQNIKIILGAKVSQIEEIKNDSLVKFVVDEEKQEVNAEKIILAVGRKPNTGDIQFDPSPAIDELGFIEVNENCETSIRNLWAVGDVVRGPMLAHKASEEGIMVAERINGQNTSMDYDLIPNVIYTHPEIAWVGKSETQLKEENANYKSGSFPFVASGRALASAEDVGSVTVIADKETDRLLSVHVFGNSASEILQQGLVAMSSGMTSEEFGSVVVSHPTVSETIKEATLSMNSKAIHILNRKKK